MRDTERIRRVTASVLQWAGWITSAGLGVWSEVQYDPNHGDFAPQWVNLAFVFALGVAITASVVRSRMRLAGTIIGAMRIGHEVARQDASRQIEELAKTIARNTDAIDELEKRG